jgi:hypothetical protein
MTTPSPPLTITHGLLVSVGLLLSAAPGCVGESPTRLQGKVTLSGQPLPADAEAYIVFAAEADRSGAVSVPIVGGRYDSPRTPRGEVTVFFEINQPTGPERTSERTGRTYRDIATLVPAKYATGMPLTVESDDPSRNFDLTP